MLIPKVSFEIRYYPGRHTLQHDATIKSFGPSGPPSGLVSLLDYIRSFCHDHSIKVLLEDSEHVDSGDGVNCSGYFESTEKVLSVGVAKIPSKWLPILLHEFCHSKQFLEDPKWFNRCSTSESYLFEWACNKRVMTRKTMLKHLKLCIDIERDCEERTIDLIRKFKVSSIVPPKDYARKANAYLYFWRYFADTRQWYEKGHPPYEQKSVYERMPSELLKDYMRMPKSIREAFHIYMKKETR